MQFPLVPNKPRPLEAVFVGARPGSDARFRGAPDNVEQFNLLRAHERQMADRPRNKTLAEA